MREETAYHILKGSMADNQVEAISKIFAITEDTPQARDTVIQRMKDAGLNETDATTLLDIFLERQGLS